MIATAATENVANRSSTAPERIAVRSVFIVAVRSRSLAANTLSPCAAPRPNSLSVSMPRSVSTKWFASRLNSSCCLSASALAVLPSSTM